MGRGDDVTFCVRTESNQRVACAAQREDFGLRQIFCSPLSFTKARPRAACFYSSAHCGFRFGAAFVCACRFCGGVWIDFFFPRASAPRRGRRRRAGEKKIVLQGTVGRDARMRRLKQHDLTPKREAGSSSPRLRKKRGLGFGEQEWQAQPNIPPEPNPNASLLPFCASRKEVALIRAKYQKNFRIDAAGKGDYNDYRPLPIQMIFDLNWLDNHYNGLEIFRGGEGDGRDTDGETGRPLFQP